MDSVQFFVILGIFGEITFCCREIPVTELAAFALGGTEDYNQYEESVKYGMYYNRRTTTTSTPPPREIIKFFQIICSNITSISQLGYYYQEKIKDQHLIFENSNISTLTSSGLLSFTTITTLQLSHTHIKTILPGAFNGLTRLKQLHLDHNELSQLSRGVYNSLHRLEILNLAGNKIDRIENLALTGADNLLELHLENNRLSTIDDGSFETLKRLTNLDLSGNPVEEVSLDGLLNLEILNMTGSALTQFDVDLSNLTMGLVNLSSSGLSSVDFAYFPRVDKVDLSGNEIVSVQNCQDLDSIYVSLDNNQIERLSGSFSRISELFLGRNKLESLKNSTFENSTTILTIDVSFNSISKIEKGVFNGLKSLTRLYLQNNAITTIDTSLFRDLTSLNILNLSHNQIGKFQFGTFDSLTMLQTLDISSNKLVSLQQYTFSSLTKLHNLHLDNNLISSFNVEDLTLHLSNLQFISLNNNSWNCEDLVKITHNLERRNRILVANGNRYNVENFRGIACKNSKNFADFANFSKISLENFNRNLQEAMDEGVKNSKMERFFNEDFAKSRFYRYFDKDYSQSNFFKYLDNYKFATMKQQDSNDTKVEKLTSLQVSPNGYNDKILIFSAVIQILIVVVLVGGFLFLFSFFKKLYIQQKPTLSSQMELVC